MIRPLSICVALVVALTCATARPARAQVAVDGGLWGVNGTTAVGAAVSLQVFKTPVLPLTVEITGAAPLDNHGYAATADARFKLAATTLGAGIGVGNVANNAAPVTVLYNAIVAQQLIPHVGLEARVYFGPDRPSSVFAGLRLSL